MQFHSVELKNFLSYQHQKFDDLNRSGLTLIEGRNLDEGDSNGSGKSSIWDGISWALFGKTLRGVDGDAVIHRKFKKDCLVNVKLKHGTYNYTVTRCRKHDEFGNKLKIEKAGTITRDIKTIELGTIDMTQNWILSEFGMDFDLFRCTVMFAQGETFNFVNESNGEQKKILSKIMKVNFSDPLAKVKALLKEQATTIADLESKIMVLKSHIKDPKTMFQDEIAEWEDEKSAKIKNIQEEARALIARSKAISDDLKSKPIEKFKEVRDKLKVQSLKIQNSMSEIQDKISEDRAKVKVLKDEIGRCESLGAKKSCPLCHGEIDSEKSRERIVKAKTEASDLEENVARLFKERATLDSKLIDYESKAELLSDKIREQESKSALIGEVNAQLIKTKSRLKDIENEENPFKGKIEAEIERQKNIQAKLKEFTATISKIKEEQPYHEFWAKAFGDDGIKSFIFDLVCSTLTNRANNYLNVLTGGHISVNFDTQKKLKSGETREKFECQVVSDGGQVSYDSYSGGEKRRISLAVDLSLADLMSDYSGSKFNMVIFDEQTSFLDKAGREGYMRLLKSAALNKRVFVVDHDAEFKAEFDSVWTIEKKDGIARLIN